MYIIQGNLKFKSSI
uniref:Uncharacterized protein n=1 Tax=Arundo donax TaxID=35708 RepID=A0A0A9GZ60_ARUDO